MGPASTDTAFVGSVPELYDTRLVPLIFQPYADDLARRAAALRPATVLETAAGTGVVTRALARALPAGTRLIATDLNQPMLDRAAAVGTDQPVQWRQADAQALPFDDASVDLVVCQFGAMFFPDKPAAYAEARRVLKPGGTLLFNVWDTIEHNELAHEVTAALAALFPADPPRFLARTPHGHGDPDGCVAIWRWPASPPHRKSSASWRAARRRRRSGRHSPTARARRWPVRSRRAAATWRSPPRRPRAPSLRASATVRSTPRSRRWW